MKRILIASAAVALGAVGLGAIAQANAATMPIPGAEPDRSALGTYGFWPASQPSNSSKVGIFIARRIPGQVPVLFYCSSPADATSKDPAACKKMENFPK
jgi:hypothetical protein